MFSASLTKVKVMCMITWIIVVAPFDRPHPEEDLVNVELQYEHL